ncbi:uncharacterized mitochondrial protein AtMg00240-like [Solanum dulcamara]|uniref:uncharacterized mitochondrial protein AtMg00240-like n=1 Tax=Solanum dulcamara TaxID=45834 RepID=UPI0024858394|nr:uncharacterized mitochondrial protein AtMg00240-like [Solanum dulcamara]
MRSGERILLNQRKYSLELILEVGLSGARPSPTLLEVNHKLRTVDYDAHVGNKADPEVEDLVGYQKLIGKLIYLTITSPDICFDVQVRSQFMQRPKQSHLDANMRVVRYLKGLPGLGLFFSSNTILELAIYCDSDWVAYSNTRRSMTMAVAELTWLYGLLQELNCIVSTPVTL